MKALFISGDASIRDIASPTRQRMQAYAEAIGELHIVLRGPKTRITRDDAITIHEVRAAKFWYPLVLARMARRIVREQSIEIVSAQDPFEIGLIGVLATKGTPAKLHVQIHADFLSPWFMRVSGKALVLNRVRRMLADFVLPRAAGVRVVSERIRRSLIVRYGTHVPDAAVLPIAVPEREPKGEALKNPFPFTLLAVSYLRPEKRVSDVLEALAIVRKTHPTVGLVIAGDGTERRHLTHRARALGIENSVRFLGARADVPELLRMAPAFVQASAFEGYGLSLVEAARAGLPIVTSDVGIVGEVLMPNESALVFPVGEVGMFASHILRLVEDEALRTTLGTHAHRAAESHLAAYTNQPVLVARDLLRTLGVISENVITAHT